MRCPQCGHENAHAAAFCSACGTQFGAHAAPQVVYVQQQTGPSGTSGMAIAGFILSFFCGLLGLIFSIIGYNEVQKSDGRLGGGGLALAGIIISIISMIIGVLMAVSK